MNYIRNYKCTYISVSRIFTMVFHAIVLFACIRVNISGKEGRIEVNKRSERESERVCINGKSWRWQSNVGMWPESRLISRVSSYGATNARYNKELILFRPSNLQHSLLISDVSYCVGGWGGDLSVRTSGLLKVS